MSPPVFLDTNIPIYAAGRPHPLKEPCARILALVAEHPDEFVTNVEVVQELLHHYMRAGLWDAGRVVVEQFMVLMEDRIEPVLVEDAATAVHIADEHRDVSARDLFHAAVMRRTGAVRITTADRDFERVAGIERLDPGAVESWGNSIGA
jgi:predicted nucleic acid-binding protein